MIFRTKLTLERDRDWSYCWDRLGMPALPLRLSRVEDEHDAKQHGGFMATKAGPLANQVGNFIVQPKPYRKFKRIHATEDSAAQMQKALNGGYRELLLEPGEHLFDRSVNCPDGTLIRGYGATLRGLGKPVLGSEKSPLFVLGNDVGIYGATLTHDGGKEVLFADAPYPTGLVLADCIFRQCNLGYWLREALIRDCLFDRAGCVIAPAGLYLRCRWQGIGPQHAWAFGFGLGSAAMIDCIFDGTDRGPIFNAINGPIEGFLSVGLACRDINQAPNGNEILLCESGPFNNALMLHTRISGCESAVCQMDVSSADCEMRDLAINGGAGLMLAGKVSNWAVQEFELRNGAGIYLGPDSASNKFANGTCIDWHPGRYNQVWRNPSKLGDARRCALWDEGRGNELANVDVLGLAPQYKPVVGFGRPADEVTR